MATDLTRYRALNMRRQMFCTCWAGRKRCSHGKAEQLCSHGEAEQLRRQA